MEVLLWNTYFGWIFQGRMKNFVSARRVLFELGFWENLFFLKTEIKGSYLLQKTFSWEVYKKMQNVSLKNPLHWGGRQQLFLTAVVFKGNFFQWKKYQTALLKLYFLLLVNFSFLPYLGHPVTTQNPKTLPLPPPQRYANLPHEQVSGLSWNLNPRKVSWLQLSFWCCTWLWLRGSL